MNKNNKIFNYIHIFLECLVIFSYLLSIIPGLYYLLFLIVIPVLGLILFLSIKKNDGTNIYIGLNLIMSLFAFLPIIGYIAIITGMIMSIMSIMNVIYKFEIFDDLSKNLEFANNNQIEGNEINRIIEAKINENNSSTNFSKQET